MKYIGEKNYKHGSKEKLGVLITNLGTPDKPNKKFLKLYLKEFLSDPRVIEIPKFFWQLILRGIILNVRPKKIAKLYGMLPNSLNDSSEGRTAADNQTVRTVFIVGPDKKIKLFLTYPMATGRNFSELLRVIDSLQLTATYKVATPADWKAGEEVIIVPSVNDEDAKKLFPAGWKSIKSYLRKVPDPSK